VKVIPNFKGKFCLLTRFRFESNAKLSDLSTFLDLVRNFVTGEGTAAIFIRSCLTAPTICLVYFSIKNRTAKKMMKLFNRSSISLENSSWKSQTLLQNRRAGKFDSSH
jgi:hypothetical protein